LPPLAFYKISAKVPAGLISSSTGNTKFTLRIKSNRSWQLTERQNHKLYKNDWQDISGVVTSPKDSQSFQAFTMSSTT